MRVLSSALLAITLAMSAWAEKPDPTLEVARAARDRGNAAIIRQEIGHAKQDASFQGQIRTALLYSWLCEALYGVEDQKGVKQAAQAGVEAAERAARLQPNSSEAHRLIGDLLGQMIPFVFGGGMRYGARSTREVDKALELDPSNVDAHIARATSYLFTPAMFGGSKQKALEHLKKAIEIDPACDTAHLWLAQVYQEMKDNTKALAELEAARRINPNRGYLQHLLKQMGGKA